MQNATKLYRILKSIQGLILVALGIVICVLFNRDGLKDAIGYCVATVVLVYGILTIGFSYMFQRGIASSDMISGTILSALSIFLFVNPELLIEFIPIVGASALFIYSLILIIEAVISFIHHTYFRGSIYIIVSLCGIALGSVSIYYFLQPNGLDIVVMLIGIILILAGCVLSILALLQPKQEVILQGSKLVSESADKIEQKDTKVAKNDAKTQSKGKKSKSEKVLEIEHKETKPAVKGKNKSKSNTNKKATSEASSDDVIVVDPVDSDK